MSSVMTEGEFVTRRLIRLYPLFVVGLLVGLVIALAQQAGSGFSSARLPLTQFLTTVFFLPFPAELATGAEAPVAPLNGPYWSLILEIHINVLFAIFFRWLGMRLLGVLVALFALGIVATAWTEGSLRGGALTPTFYYGVIRVGFSFLAGALICRLRHCLRVPGLHWAPALVIVTGLLALPTPDSIRWIYSVVCVLLLFPMLILAAAAAQPANARLHSLFAMVGAASYALYAIHGPIADLAHVVAERWPVLPYRAWGLLFLVPTVAASFALITLFDIPVRRWLTNRYQQRKLPKLAVSPPGAEVREGSPGAARNSRFENEMN